MFTLSVLLVAKQAPSFTFRDRDPSNKLLQDRVSSLTAIDVQEATLINPPVCSVEKRQTFFGIYECCNNNLVT